MDQNRRIALGAVSFVVLAVVVVGGSFLIGLVNNDCPSTLSVSADPREVGETSTDSTLPDGDDGPTDHVDFANLSERRQAEFVDALENNYTDINTGQGWGSIHSVKYRGEWYTTTVANC